MDNNIKSVVSRYMSTISPEFGGFDKMFIQNVSDRRHSEI